MAPTLLRGLVSKISARAAVEPTRVFDSGPLMARAMLLARDTVTATVDPAKGVVPPEKINNKGFFALFGLLGVAIVVGIIWFFFWAKNGGFYFKENDWDEYKSTVLRRRGPNGTILSNATPSTNLGGGSIYYKDVDDNSTEDATTVVSDGTALSGTTGITGGVSDIVGNEKRRKKREERAQREREKERRREEKEEKKRRKKAKGLDDDESGKKTRSNRRVNEDGVLIDEAAEQAAKEQLRHYRHEKAARVGGINKPSDSSEWDGSTNPSASTVSASDITVTSDLMSHREHTPTSTPKKTGGGIRKVYSTADRNDAREQERLRLEARRQQKEEKRRRAAEQTSSHQPSSSGGRRDFSWQYGEDVSTPLRPVEEMTEVSALSAVSDRSERRERRRRQLEEREHESHHHDDDDRHTSAHVPGGWSDSGAPESDLGTKSYVHHIPGLSSSNAGSSVVGSSVVGSSAETNEYSDYAEEKRKKRQQQRSSGYRR